MVVTLRAQVHLRVILIGKYVGGAQKIVVRGEQRVAHLGGICRGLMRVMADGTGDPDIRISYRQGLMLYQAQAG